MKFMMLALVGSTLSTAALARMPQVHETVAPGKEVAFEIYVPPSAERANALHTLLGEQQDPSSRNYHRWLTPSAYAARFGTERAILAPVEEELREAGFAVVERHAHGLRVSGKAAAVASALGAELHHATGNRGGNVMVSTTGFTLTPALADAHATILAFGLRHEATTSASRELFTNGSGIGPYVTGHLRQAFKAPADYVVRGTGATIGILMANAYLQSDINYYFQNFIGIPTPQLSRVDVDGGAPFDAEASAETTLDITQAGGFAPGASMILYNLPDLSDQSIYDGLVRIVQDNVVDVVNMSFASPEIIYTPDYNDGQDVSGIIQAEESVIEQGSAQGITFVTGSGDLGSRPVPAFACFAKGATSDCGGYVTSVEFPASSPYVTGVGGVNLVTTVTATSNDARVVRENAFPDQLARDTFFGTPAMGGFWGSGGGESIFFESPSFQANTGLYAAGRTVPDVAGHMGGCPASAVQPCQQDRSSDLIVLNGHGAGEVGTSASSPNFAGVLALTIGASGRQGNINPALYALKGQNTRRGQPVFLTGIAIPGSNGDYTTSGRGYDEVIGLGVPYIANLEGGGLPLAGVLGSTSNP